MKDDSSKLNESEVEYMGERITISEEELMRSYGELIDTKERLQALNEALSVNNKKLVDIQERFTLATDGANDVIWDINLITRETFFSNKWFELLEYDREELGTDFNTWLNLVHPEDLDRTKKENRAHLNGDTPVYSSEYRLKTKSGNYKWVLARGRALFNIEGKAIRFAGSLTDISHIKEYEQKLYYLAFNDSLTGLLNRTCSLEDLKYRLENGLRATTFYMDIDKFEMINNVFGHAMADKILIEIANRLREIASDIVRVYRINSDKFGIIIDAVYTQKEIEAFAEIIMNLIARPVRIEDKTIDVTACIAVTLLPDHGQSVEEMINNTDIAMHIAKQSGCGTYAIYESAMYDRLVERQNIEDRLRIAISNDELMLCYQPQVDLESKKVLSLEALLRWHSKDLGYITPDRFIPIAEEAKLIIPLGDWVINKACLFIKRLHEQGHCDLAVSVNVSVVQLTQNNFADNLISCLRRHNLDPKYLEIEITESVFMESYKEISNNILRLREIGMKVALDDFGKGYSSLGHLAYLPITTLKIDKCFIDDICSPSNGNALTGLIINIGHSLGLEVVAEGVESEKQLGYLETNSCDKIQGYIYSKPLPEDEVIRFVKEFKAS